MLWSSNDSNVLLLKLNRHYTVYTTENIQEIYCEVYKQLFYLSQLEISPQKEESASFMLCWLLIFVLSLIILKKRNKQNITAAVMFFYSRRKQYSLSINNTPMGELINLIITSKQLFGVPSIKYWLSSYNYCVWCIVWAAITIQESSL